MQQSMQARAPLQPLDKLIFPDLAPQMDVSDDRVGAVSEKMR